MPAEIQEMGIKGFANDTAVCAGLFASGGGKDIAVGVVICVVFPAVMVIGSAIFVARHIYRNHKRRAAYVLAGDPELEEHVSVPPYSHS